MSALDRLLPLLDHIPEQEHEQVARLFEYHLTLLRLMPAQQRAQEYERAELALVHYERYASTYRRVEDEREREPVTGRTAAAEPLQP